MLPYELRQSLEHCTNLPSLPSVVLRVIELARDPDINIQQIVATLGNDPALSARVLSLANTVYFAHSSPVEDLQQAVNRIGLERTLSLALGCSLVSATKIGTAPGLDLERYWQRSLICALSAKSLADTLGLDGESGALYTVALLQDIGILALYAIDAENYRSLLDRAEDHLVLVKREREIYDTDHAEVGAWLASQWQLSERTSRWIGVSHESLTKAESRDDKARNCLIASSILADAWLEGEVALSSAMASLENRFGLDTPKMISKIMSLQEQLPQVAVLYDIALPERLDANQLMFEAKLLLAEKNARLQQDLLRQQQEIEQLRREQEALSFQAKIDSLTRLYNRHYIEDKLRHFFPEACETEKPLSLLFIDLDRFKEINDHFGHSVGDKVLVGFAEVLHAMFEESGFYAGRYGGEEFVIVMPGVDAEHAQLHTERLRQRVATTCLAEADGAPIKVTASYGIATVENSCRFRNVEAFINAADKSMYNSKHGGCDRITVFSGAQASRV